MKRALEFCLPMVLLLAVSATPQQPPQTIATTHLKVGETAPDFTLLDQNWKKVKLSDYRAKKNVVLAFYVLAFTSGWTKELQAYQADQAKLEASDSVVMGISIDSPAANAAFAKQIGVTFPLLSDMNRKVVKQYGILKEYDVQNEKYEWARRTTIVVDKRGVIQHIEHDNSAVDPNTALTICTNLHKKQNSQ